MSSTSMYSESESESTPRVIVCDRFSRSALVALAMELDGTAGASAPEVLVNEVIDAFRARFETVVEPVETAVETVEFKVPRILREPA